MIYTLAVLGSLIAASNAALFTSNEQMQKYMWDSFKREYSKSYATMEEETSRFSHFLVNLKIADQRNIQEKLAGGTAVHGISRFSDMSQEEFALRFLKADPSMKVEGPKHVVSTPPKNDLGLVDWTGVLTTPVKNQGYCGSCWAFSATEQIESDTIRTQGVTYVLSPEQITQCDRAAFGCGGGWTETAYTYVHNAGGITTESVYPYTSYSGTTGTCKVDSSTFKVTVGGYKVLGSESEMASYVQSTGPLSICIDANNWNSYTGGIMKVCGTSVDHCVQAVGVDASSGGYWKVRNSWGVGWGESGYIRLAYGQNTCAITNDPSFVEVTLV